MHECEIFRRKHGKNTHRNKGRNAPDLRCISLEQYCSSNSSSSISVTVVVIVVVIVIVVVVVYQ